MGMRSSRTRCWRKASTPSWRCSTAEWVAPQKAALHEKTLRISHSTRERVPSIGKDGNNGSQGQATRHEQVAGSTPRPECPLPRRVERIPARTQRAVGDRGRAPAAERAGRRQRRALPAGGLIREDYVFESAADGSKVRFSELFAPGKNSLVIYNMMFPRWSQDQR